MKSIKFFLFLFLLTSCCCTLSTRAQDRKVKVSLQYGSLNGGCMDDKEYSDYISTIHSEWGRGANADISFFVTKRFFVTVHLSEGICNYSAKRQYEVSGTRGNDNGTYTIATVGLLAGYRLPLTEWSNLSGQIGFGQFNLLGESSYTVYTDTGNPDHPYEFEDGYNYQTGFTASVPVKVAIGFQPFKKMDVGFARNFEIGYACGLDIAPDFGIFTFFYHGPQISFTF